MVIRELPPEEFHRLQGLPMLDGLGLDNANPDFTRFVVAEVEGEIMGFWALTQAIHVEPIWVHPTLRGTTAPGRMWVKVKQILADFRIKTAFCCVDTPTVSGYVQRLGFEKMPHDLYRYKEN